MRPITCLLFLSAALAATAGVRRTPVVVAVEAVAPAVVAISASSMTALDQAPADDPEPLIAEFFASFAEPRLGFDQLNLGSGLVVDAEGRVVTTAHVVRRASALTVVLTDGRRLPATVLGTDPQADVALLQVARDGVPLPYVDLAAGDDLMLGETLVVIGNPLGLGPSVTIGVLSATGRSVRVGRRLFADLLQTDAAINPGNSGGPLIDLEGSVVGMATASAVGGHGIGFAVPTARVRRSIDVILGKGQPTAWIGLDTRPVDSELARVLGLAPRSGEVVTHVFRDGPAAAAGVRRGDVLIRVAGRPLGVGRGLQAAVAQDGGRLVLELLRDGEPRSLTVEPYRKDSRQLVELARARLGLEVELEVRGGLRVRAVAAGGLGAAHGFVTGDRLLDVDGRPLARIEDYEAALVEALHRRSALVLVEHLGATYYVPIPFE